MTEFMDHDLVQTTAEIVAAFVSNNAVRVGDLPDIISGVHAALTRLTEPKAEVAAPSVLTPAVSIKKSVTDDYLVCLDDGKKFKSLKRHLATLGMTPDQYRMKWGLPRDYPMTAPGYAATRSQLAKTIGLGSNRRKANVPAAVAPEPANDAPAEAPTKRRGRPKKAA